MKIKLTVKGKVRNHSIVFLFILITSPFQAVRRSKVGLHWSIKQGLKMHYQVYLSHARLSRLSAQSLPLRPPNSSTYCLFL
jgi:hypothetical protein